MSNNICVGSICSHVFCSKLPFLAYKKTILLFREESKSLSGNQLRVYRRKDERTGMGKSLMPQLTIVIISLISETVINSYVKSFGTLYTKDRILFSMEKNPHTKRTWHFGCWSLLGHFEPVQNCFKKEDENFRRNLKEINQNRTCKQICVLAQFWPLYTLKSMLTCYTMRILKGNGKKKQNIFFGTFVSLDLYFFILYFTIILSLFVFVSEPVNILVYWSVNILVYCPGPVNIMFSTGFCTNSFFCLRYTITKNMSSDRFASIEYNITNSSWHFGPNGSLWTGLSPTK